MFETHKVTDAGFAEIGELKRTMSNACRAVLALMPEGREKSLFKTKIEEAMFFGTKAVAGKVGNFTEIQTYESSEQTFG